MIIWGVEMTVDFHAIGQRIRQKRREKHMTQEALAEALSVSVGYVSNMERGITKISLTTLAKIAGAVDCELGELVSGTAVMYGRAVACDNAIVTAGCIRNDAIICGNARIRENTATRIAPVVTGQSVVMGDLSGSIVVFERGFILPGQTVDNPTRRLIGINERCAAIVRDPDLTPDRDTKNRNTPER